MKTFKLFFVLALVSLITVPFNSFSQAEKSVEENFEIQIGVVVSNGYVVSWPIAGVERIYITPSGNYTRTVNLQVDPNDPIMQLANPVAILTVYAWVDIDGDPETVPEFIIDDKAVLTSSGNLMLVYHVKGKSK